MEAGNNKPVDIPQQVQNPDEQVMTLKDWIIVSLILIIPFVNIIMLFVWAFGSSGNLNRKNYAKAQLIILGAFLVIYIFFLVMMMATVASMF